ncbi:MAG TPA: hypothetical protein VJZ25_07105 [Gemmatimonadaceae bacterium]|nr:hypothetical protein [Gemmatimonadaceae bacterium]
MYRITQLYRRRVRLPDGSRSRTHSRGAALTLADAGRVVIQLRRKSPRGLFRVRWEPIIQ